ncbi:hypothetical protein F2Q69_00022787 [Brassica cretica]|uniref:Uncharacterized protein n=1 Tax=Brassica cretica TaxID=69181 RepID=A0A8S9QF88_BRACR|nr:hypothetical protein F2Q69_00022787 [Brassica cretica]
MANERFGPHLPTILKGPHIDDVYELCGVDYGVEISLPEDHEIPETVRPGYYGAYMPHFRDCGLSFPSPPSFLKHSPNLFAGPVQFGGWPSWNELVVLVPSAKLLSQECIKLALVSSRLEVPMEI